MTYRASYQDHRHITLGGHKKPSVLTSSTRETLKDIQHEINRALQSTSEGALTLRLQKIKRLSASL